MKDNEIISLFEVSMTLSCVERTVKETKYGMN